MKQKNICQFYIIIGDKEFRPINDGNVYINATGVMDINLINSAILRAFSKKNKENIMVSNEIIFLIPSVEFMDRCQEIMTALNIRGRIEFMELREQKEVNKVEDNLKKSNDITASGSKTIEISKNTGIEKVTISDRKAYVNSGSLSIDEQKFVLLQEWKKDPYMNRYLATLSSEEIDRKLMENVTKNLTSYRLESSREQLASDKVGKVAMDKATNEDGLVNAELGIVENNVSNSNQYSTVEQNGENVYVVNPNVTSATINSGGVSNNSNSNYSNWDANIVVNDEQEREILNEFYLDENYNVYDNSGTVIGKIGQNGLIIDYNNNTLMMNGKMMGNIGDYKDMGKGKTVEKKNTRVLKKDENKSVGFVSLPVVMFVLSAMLLIGSVILLFVLE